MEGESHPSRGSPILGHFLFGGCFRANEKHHYVNLGRQFAIIMSKIFAPQLENFGFSDAGRGGGKRRRRRNSSAFRHAIGREERQ